MSLSQGAYLYTGNHDFRSPGFELLLGSITIGDDAWIAARAVLAPSAQIGPGAVVALGAAVSGSVPAVCHVDGTGRLQTVREPDNCRYARLIRCFHARTGVPMVLNTSYGLRPTSSTTKTNRSSAHPTSARLPERPGAAARAAIAATEPPVRPTRLKAPARPGHLAAQSGADPRRSQSAIPRMP